MYVCVCVCMYVCMHACARARVCVCVCMCGGRFSILVNRSILTCLCLKVISTGLLKGPFRNVESAIFKENMIVFELILFCGTFLRLSSLSPTTYNSEMSDCAIILNKGGQKLDKTSTFLVLNRTKSYV